MENPIPLEDLDISHRDNKAIIVTEPDGSIVINKNGGPIVSITPCDETGKFTIDNGSAYQEFQSPRADGRYKDMFSGLIGVIGVLGSLDSPMTREAIIESLINQ